MYSKEDIEKKRLEALQRKNQKATSDNINKEDRSTSSTITSNHIKMYKSVDMNESTSKRFTNYKRTIVPKLNKVPSYKNYQGKSQSAIKLQSFSNRYNPMQSTSSFYSSKQMYEVTCSMISSNRFTVEMSMFNPKLIDLFKTIPTRIYDFQNKLWNFHIKDYSMLCEKVQSLKSDVIFKGLPNFLVKTFQNLLKKESEPQKVINLSGIDQTLMNSLYPFQKEGIEFGISMNGKCLIADDMGLGKTRQALGIASYYRKDWPLIIVTPSSMRYQWFDAIMNNVPSVSLHSIQHILSTKDYIENSQVLIFSYDLLTRKIDDIIMRKYGVVICDESHYLKSIKTQRTKAVQRLVENSRHVILLTGTPALSRPIELHSQIKLIMPSFMSYQEFGMRYCAGVKTNFGWDFTGSSNLKELEILLKACCLIRRLKSDVILQLPSKIRQKIMLDPHLIKDGTKELEAASKSLEKSSLHGGERRKALIEYYAETSKAKEKAVCNYINDVLESREKFIVFAHHKNMLDAISNLLTSKKILFIRIDGKTKAEQRKDFVDLFQEDEKVLVAVLSITAANAGITLTAARLVIFAELTWNPGILSQAEDRVHRIGQTDNVVIRYLLAKQTADDHLWPAIQKKIDVLNEVGLDQNFDMGQLEMSKQSPVLTNQRKMNEYMEISGGSKSLNTSNLETGNSALHVRSDGLKHLLNVDDDAFNDINLDNMY